MVEHEEDTIEVSFVSGASGYQAAMEAVAAKLEVDPSDLVLKMQSEDWGEVG